MKQDYDTKPCPYGWPDCANYGLCDKTLIDSSQAIGHCEDSSGYVVRKEK